MAYPKHGEIELPLLGALQALGGGGHPKDIYPLVAEHFPDLTEEERIARLPSNDSTYRWHNLVQWVRQTLVEKGEIDGSTRGLWKLTSKGRTRLEQSNGSRGSVAIPTVTGLNLELPPGTGVEDEILEPSESIRDPFDPTLIRVDRATPTLDLLVRRIRNGEINLSPEFQRKGGIWTTEAQSRLIESILIRIPLPAFYVDATCDDYWIVVDGLQRLTAIKRFIIEGSLELRGLEFLSQIEGKRYTQLPRNFQRRIDETEVTIFTIQAGTPETVKFNIFKRINTGGLPLSAQEIRNALNGKQVRDFLISLAASQAFLRATGGGINDRRMADRECATRFCAFVLRDPETYSGKDFDAFLNDVMREIDTMPPAKLVSLENKFQNSMDAAYEIFGPYAFRKFFGRNHRLLPINKAVFESWSVNLADLSPDAIQRLIDRKNEILDAFATLMNDAGFQAAVSQGTGDVNKVKLRFRRIKELITNFLDR